MSSDGIQMKTVVLISTNRNDRSETLAKLCADTLGLDTILLPPIYHISEDSDIWKSLKEINTPIVVLSDLHPKPVEWLLRKHNIGRQGICALNINAFDSPEGCFTALREMIETPLCARQGSLSNRSDEIKDRWYPVLDYSRCENCGHCLQFCLFGVYEHDCSGRVTVTHPDNCKPGCPACSRICPQGAIMFPLYDRNNAIAGAPGTVMSPDPAARKMFYERTGRTCPVCGRGPDKSAENRKSKAGNELCPECGRSIQKNEIYDEIDALIDDLDDFLEGDK